MWISPKFNLKVRSASELIAELDNDDIPSIDSQRGRNGGTYACKELMAELKGEDSTLLPTDITRGRNGETLKAESRPLATTAGRYGGTYVCKELVTELERQNWSPKPLEAKPKNYLKS